MLSCSLLFSDPFFLLNTLHYSLIFRFVKQFFKKYYVFSLKIVKIYFLTQKTRIFIIEEKAQNQKASYNEDSFAMLNDVLDWCETYQVYAVVDFHAATAGQSGIPCDDGVDNGQHLYDDEESMERMFLLMEEFMRRYKDRWIIGAYDCINEPISMTPRREELTPKLVYFYEEMIRRCRKIDQKHLFLLNGTQFSSLTYFFDHEFDPEYHNWGISLHAYEMVVPEVASLASVLRTCREQKICLWMGETGGRNEHAWQTTMYEILAEYHAGYNLWCWKTEGAGCASILNFNVPDEWHLITDYAINGAAKPSYEHAQAIWDSYLECLAVDKCKENTQYHPYLLREGNFEIPAIGYNALPMDSHRGLSDLPNAAGYRLYDRFELVYEKGYHPEPAGFAAPGPIKHPRDHVQLQLGAGEYASVFLLFRLLGSLFRRLFARAENSAYPCKQLLYRKGLRDVVVRAHVKPADLVRYAVSRREQNHRHVGRSSGAAENLDSVQLRQHYVENDEVVSAAFDFFKPLAPVRRLVRLVALVRQLKLHEPRDFFFVFDDKNLTHLHLRRFYREFFLQNTGSRGRAPQGEPRGTPQTRTRRL